MVKAIRLSVLGGMLVCWCCQKHRLAIIFGRVCLFFLPAEPGDSHHSSIRNLGEKAVLHRASAEADRAEAGMLNSVWSTHGLIGPTVSSTSANTGVIVSEYLRQPANERARIAVVGTYGQRVQSLASM